MQNIEDAADQICAEGLTAALESKPGDGYSRGCSLNGCGGQAVARYEAETGVDFVIAGRFRTGPANGYVCPVCLDQSFRGDNLRAVIVRYFGEQRTLVYPRALAEPDARLLQAIWEACNEGSDWLVFCGVMDAARAYAFEVSGLRAKLERR